MRDYKREFAARQTRQILITAVFFVPLVAVAVARVQQGPGPIRELMGLPPRTWMMCYVPLLIVAIVLSFRNWRCPACGAPLSRTFNHPCCRHCGTRLQ